MKPWRIFLLNNGLMTPQLQIVLGHTIAPTILSNTDVDELTVGREVVLKGTESGISIWYAYSEWDKKALDELLPDKSKPIGSLIAQKGFER